MGRRGPAPKPTELKRLQGTVRADRDSTIGDAFDDTMPYCPSYLSDEAKLEWRRVAKHLHQVGILKYVDRAVMAAYVDAYGRFIQILAAMDGQPFTYETDKGYVYPNPLIKQLEAAKGEMLRFMRELGLTPSSRARIVVKDGGKAEELNLAEALFEAVHGGR